MAHGGDIYRNKVKYDFSVNINSFGTPEAVLETIREHAGKVGVYPDERCEKLCEAIAKKEGVNKEEVLCGNGASELIMSVVHAHRPKKALLTAPAFSEYERALHTCGCAIDYYFLDEGTGFCIQNDYLEMITEDLDMVILCEPSNPVGVLTDAALLREIACRCRSYGCLLVIDACFLSFTGEEKNVKEAVGREGVLWLSAFTKLYAMPGIRLGCLICDSWKEKEKIRDVQPAWSVSSLAMEAGITALMQDAYLNQSLADIKREREYLSCELRKIGCKVFFSKADFLMFYCEYPLYDALLKRQILIRDCSDYKGLKDGYYRIAVKRHEENRILLDAIREAIKSCKTVFYKL